MADFRMGHHTAPAATATSNSSLMMSAPRPEARRHENRVLAGLPPNDLALLTRHIHVVSLPPGAVLQHQKIGLDHLFFPHQGVISLLAMTSNGETIEVASAGRGGAICPILSSEPRDGVLIAIAQGALRASRIHATHVQAALAESAALARAMESCREALLLQMRHNLVCCGLHSVEHRLARWLLETADRLELELVPATQENVAQRLGVRRTTVTLLASKLQEIGAIRWGRSRVEVLDRARLEAAACGCYASLRERTSNLLPADPAAGRAFFG